MNITWWHYVLWIVAAAGLGFLQSFVLADRLRLARRTFLIFYMPITGTFLYLYARWTSFDPQAASTANLGLGVFLTVLGGAFLVKNVLSQPASSRSHDAQLFIDVIWVGAVYGILDALLLSVMPVHALRAAFSLLELGDSVVLEAMIGVAALATCVLITVAYHIGYPEFRGGKRVVAPIIGNSICSLIYLLSGNILAAVLAHVAMHIAAVFHGPETTVQLPPHYPGRQTSRSKI